jgi:hypothetical protein
LRTITRTVPKFAWVVVIAVSCAILWAAERSPAQNLTQDAPPVVPGENAGPSLKESSLPPVEATKPESPRETVTSRLADLPADPSLPAPDTGPALAPVTASASAAETAHGASTPVPAVDDPDKAALAFVEQNQKRAEVELKNLKDEEAKLRSRLQKVEAGIRRWQTLVEALKQSQTSASRVVPDAPRTRTSVGTDSEPQLDRADSDRGLPKSRRPRAETPIPPTDDDRLALPTPK